MEIGANFKIFFKSFISLILILLLIKRFDLTQVWSLLLNIDHLCLLIAFLLTPISWMIHACRWQLLLSALGWTIPSSKLIVLNLVATFYALFLPGYTISGGIIRALRLINLTGDALKSILSIIMDRVMVILPRLLIIPLCLMISPPLIIEHKSLRGVFIFASLTLFFMAIILGVMLSRRLSLSLERAIKRALQRFQMNVGEGLLQNLKEGGISLWNLLKVYQNHRFSVGISFGYGVASCILNGLWFYLIALALDVRIPFGAILWILSIVTLVEMFPISIAGIGVREGSFVFLLGHYGVLPAVAFSISLIVFFFQILEGEVGGLLEIWAGRRRS